MQTPTTIHFREERHGQTTLPWVDLGKSDYVDYHDREWDKS